MTNFFPGWPFPNWAILAVPALLFALFYAPEVVARWRFLRAMGSSPSRVRDHLYLIGLVDTDDYERERAARAVSEFRVDQAYRDSEAHRRHFAEPEVEGRRSQPNPPEAVRSPVIER